MSQGDSFRAGERVTVPLPAEDALREIIETLAAMERRAGSDGEREAANWIAERMRSHGVEAVVDDEEAYDSFADFNSQLAAVGAAGGLLALVGARRLGGLIGAAAVAGIADECANGPRVFRRMTGTPSTTTNVVGIAGDPDADRTIVVMSHHDAAPTGQIFDPSFQEWLGKTFPTIVERADTAIPMWWPVLAGPGLVAAGALTKRRKMIAAGAALAAGAAAAFGDIARSDVVPGANDNLSAVAGVLYLAEALKERPVKGIRVMLVSCGAEETLQGGMRPFAARHLAPLDRDKTWVLNLDTVGSPRLVMLEGEGPIVMEDYPRLEFRDLVAESAQRAGIRLRRGMRARSSTDSVIAARMGFPTATLVSVDRNKALSNYHLPSDTPENLDYATVARAAALAECVVRDLAEPD